MLLARWRPLLEVSLGFTRPAFARFKSTREDVSAEEAEDVTDEVDSNETSTSLIRPRIPDHTPTLLAIPICRRPLFPGFYKTITVKDGRVAAAMAQALRKGRPWVGLFMQRHGKDGDSADASVELDERDTIGQIGDIHRAEESSETEETASEPEDSKPADASYTAIVYPHRRVRATKLLQSSPISRVAVENEAEPQFNARDPAIRALCQELFAVMADLAKLSPFFREHLTHHNVPAGLFDDPVRLADLVTLLCASGDPAELQSQLDEPQMEARLRGALALLKRELATAQLQQRIAREVEGKLSERQRQYLLHEQLKAIKRELGMETDAREKLLETLQQRAKQLEMPLAVKQIFDEEIGRLSTLETASAEFGVCRNYLDWLTQLPWGKSSPNRDISLQQAKEILDEDHWGMEDVKDRILEHLATTKLTTSSASGKVLCLVGPPGVGKTSIGKSIAKAMGKEYYRFSVGGLSDVAEIRGHRRTYVGAMPGKPVQALRRVQVDNPLILIDEIDKINQGGRVQGGDPTAALLELLDPEQNRAFLDHYLDVPVDMGRVMWVCTANTLDTIPAPLLDRLEVIQLAGYVAEEKRNIAKKYLIPQAERDTGINPSQVHVSDAALDALIRQWCRESGVRNLKKHLERIYRKVALNLVKARENSSAASQNIDIGVGDLKGYLGSPPFTSDRLFVDPLLPVGVVTGLAWTAMGGSILYIETLLLEAGTKKENGSGRLIRTGQLGKVMDESTTIAHSYAKAFLLEHWGVKEHAVLQQGNIHLHVPEGAVPKDGPSAGCTMACSLISLACGKPIPSNVAMTGELTLTGRVLRIGGVREKVVGARRSGITRLILPASNRAEWEELPEYLRDGLEVRFVERFEEIASYLGLIPDKGRK